MILIGENLNIMVKKIGQAMKHMERKKIFIITKLKVKEGETSQSLIDRFGKCLERMKTDHADALFIHDVAMQSGRSIWPIRQLPTGR